MEYTISKILETAVRINRQIIKEFLVEEQTKSGYSAQVFFGMLNDEIQIVSMKYKTNVEKYEWFKQFDDVLPVLELNDMLKFFSEFESRVEQFELVGEIVNKLFEQSISGIGAKPNPDSSKEEKKEEEKEEEKEVSLVSKFNGMSMEEVRAFFMPLVTKKNKDGKHWMTEENFEIFMKRSFLKIDLPKPKINVGHGNKYAVVALFYKYYDFCDSESFTENNKKEPYLSLLKNAFNTTTFNDVELSNFKVKSNYSWK
uniref:hypothetical protein n=1 Tax=Algoriphagus sp. TaxID=1872435 RepID=UPI004047BE28